jgi:hypothetical protein
MKQVKVKWVDSCSPEKYWNWDVDGKADHIVTIGFLVRKTRKTIVICASLGESSKGGFMTIPRCSIKSIKKLK